MRRAGRNSRHATGIILIERIDHAVYIASVELAPGKARTAALFRKPSQALEDAINHGGVAAVTAHDLDVTDEGDLVGSGFRPKTGRGSSRE
jgi:uncharacterized protein GlcG (DUF336 family)